MLIPDLTADPAVLEVATEAVSLTSVTTHFAVRNADGFTAAGTLLTRIKAQLKTLEDARTRITKPINDALRAVNAQAKEAAAPLLNAEARIKTALTTYNREQEELRRIEQRKADEEAARQRAKVEAEARAARAKAEADAAELRRKAEAEAAAGRVAEAAKLAARAQTTIERAEDKAQELELQASSVVAPIITREAPKVAGISMREVWKFEVTDATKINAAFLMPDEAKIRKLVQSMRGDAASVIGAGVRVWAEKSVAAGAA
jgi:colicin import membrane protein